MVPKWSENGRRVFPKWSPNGFQIVPGWSRNCFKMVQSVAPKHSHICPRVVLKRSQNGQTMIPRKRPKICDTASCLRPSSGIPRARQHARTGTAAHPQHLLTRWRARVGCRCSTIRIWNWLLRFANPCAPALSNRGRIAASTFFERTGALVLDAAVQL